MRTLTRPSRSLLAQQQVDLGTDVALAAINVATDAHAGQHTASSGHQPAADLASRVAAANEDETTTEAVLGAVISWGELLKSTPPGRLLSRPPVRFLYDLFALVASTTGKHTTRDSTLRLHNKYRWRYMQAQARGSPTPDLLALLPPPLLRRRGLVSSRLRLCRRCSGCAPLGWPGGQA
jgi:hypothetical protein